MSGNNLKKVKGIIIYLFLLSLNERFKALKVRLSIKIKNNKAPMAQRLKRYSEEVKMLVQF